MVSIVLLVLCAMAISAMFIGIILNTVLKNNTCFEKDLFTGFALIFFTISTLCTLVLLTALRENDNNKILLQHNLKQYNTKTGQVEWVDTTIQNFEAIKQLTKVF